MKLKIQKREKEAARAFGPHNLVWNHKKNTGETFYLKTKLMLQLEHSQRQRTKTPEDMGNEMELCQQRK